MATPEEACAAIIDAVDIAHPVFPHYAYLWQDDPDSYITYGTILDIHLSNSQTFSPADQNTVLQVLQKLLLEQKNVAL
jgi:hypothetical protein